MDRNGIIVCSIVGLLGLLSVITGFSAEGTRIKVDRGPDPSICVYSRNPAFMLGFTSSISLLIAQVITTVMTGCLCCRRSPQLSNCKCTIAVICLILSWIFCVLALFFLLGAAVLNELIFDLEEDQCYAPRVVGLFALGACLSFSCIILGMVSYLISNPDSDIQKKPVDQGGITLGQTQVVQPPADARDPVFVHEDTYKRRQFV